MLYLSQSFNVVVLIVMWLFVMATGFVSSLKATINNKESGYDQALRASMLLPFVMHTMITIIPLLFV